MKKLVISLGVILMLAVGGGTIILPGQIETEEGAKWEYGVGSKYHYLFSDYYQEGVLDITLDLKFKF